MTDSQGTVVTFYSFKGGTGRTMALANVAWILASNGKRVLAADWDLESPGLHRFLAPFLDQAGMGTTRGVIGMIQAFENAHIVDLPRPPGWHREYSRVVPWVVQVDWQFPGGGSLDFLPAGSHNRDFASQLLSLNWDTFFERLGGELFFDALREDMKANYDYVLVDSRTGLSDVSDICTIHLPDVLVDCFTLSEQGIDGAANRALEIITGYPNRDIRILPAPMRVDEGEKERADAGRASARERFAKLLADKSETERLRYWGEVEIPYRVFYAYEEILAAFGDAPGGATSLLSAFERLTKHITEGAITQLPPMEESERLDKLELFIRRPKRPLMPLVVCHVSADVMWGEWITDVLRAAGCTAEALDISGTPPAPSPDVRVVAVLSRSFADTPSAVDFMRGAQLRSTSSTAHRLVGLQVRGAPSEQPIADLAATTLTDLPEKEAAAVLLRAVGVPGSPKVDISRLTARYPGRTPAVWNALTRNPNFTGRGKDLGRLYEHLRSGTGASDPVVLHGLGGVGKTQLALEYVHRFQADYDLVWWMDASQPNLTDTALIKLAEHFDLHAEPVKQVNAVVNALRQGKHFPRSLLIFDNADRPEDVARFLPGGPHTRVLITSRNRDWAASARAIEINVFDRTESVEHLTRQVRGIQRKDAESVADALGDLPIAIAVAGALLSETGTSVRSFLNHLGEHASETLSAVKPPDYPNVVAATWAISLEQLAERNKAALRLYEICAVLAPEISIQLITGEAMASVLVPLDRTLTLSIRRGALVRELQRLALIKLDSDRDSIHVHRVVQAVLRDAMTPEKLASTLLDAQRVLAAARPSELEAADSPAFWPVYEQLWPHLEPSELISSDLPKAWELLADRVRYLWRVGDLENALSVGRRIDEAWTAKLAAMDPDHPDAPTLRTWLLHLRFNIANTLRSRGSYLVARELDEAVLAEQTEFLGPSDPYTLMTAGSLASDMRAAGEYRAAFELDEKTYAGFREVFGERNRRTLALGNNIADDLRRLGDYRGARDWDSRVLRDRRSLLGATNPYTLHSAAYLARDLREVGEYEQSVTRLRETLANYQATLGDDAPETLGAKVSLAVSLRAVGSVEEAHQLTADALRRYEALYEPSNPDLLACQINHAADHFAQGRWEHAAHQTRAAVETLEKSLGVTHPYTLACVNNLATYMRSGGDSKSALAAARRAFDGLEATLGSGHPHTLAARMTLANCLAEIGDHSGALWQEEEAAVRLETGLGADHPDTLRCRANMAISQVDLQFADGEAVFHRALAALETRLGPKHPVVRNMRLAKRAERILEPQVI